MLALLALLTGSAVAQDDGPAELLDAALADLAEGRLTQGCTALQDVARGFPGTDEARWAERIAQTVRGLEPGRCTWVARATEIATDGRTELIVSQAVVVPAWMATAPPIHAPDAAQPEVIGVLIIAGLGAGIGGTYALTRNREVSTGQAMMVYTGEVLGTWYGAWFEAVASDDFTGQPAHIGTLVGAGLGVGAAVAFPDASAGDVALVRSGATWGTAYGAVAAVGFETASARETLGTLGGGTTIGLVAGSLLTSQLEVGRGQVNAINLGGYAGALTGGGIALIVGESLSPSGGALLVGSTMTVGLVVGGVLTLRDPPSERSALGRMSTMPAPTAFRTDDGQLMPGVMWSGAF